MNARTWLLEEAKAIVTRSRIQNYSAPEKNFANIADLWTVILGRTITPAQVALCMDAVKTARLIDNPNHEDSWVDKAGYAACGYEVTR